MSFIEPSKTGFATERVCANARLIFYVYFLFFLGTGCAKSGMDGVKSSSPVEGGDSVREQNLALSQRKSLLQNYEKSDLLPAIGSKVVFESKQSYLIASGTKSCSYMVRESSELLEKADKIVVQVEYQQTRLSSDSSCPEKNPFLVNHVVSHDPDDFYLARQADIMWWTEPEYFVERFKRTYRSAQLISARNETWKDQSIIRFRLLVSNEKNEKFYIDSRFSAGNSFWGLLDVEEVDLKTNQARKIRSLIELN